MDIKTGIWTHYSGSQFEVIGIATGSSYSASDLDLVIYRGVRSGQLYYRPTDEFFGSETVDGHMIPRFTYTGELTEVNQG